jgi:endonuclease/exonuclease/phosphatase family metal-dependent hydrolase
MILALDADVVAFEEVQNEKILGHLFRTRVNPKIKDKEYRFTSFVCIPARDPRGINVALATRLAVTGTLSFHDREFGPLDGPVVRFSRDLLGVELFATTAYRFLVFVAHLKSKLGADHGEAKRALEVQEIRTILETPQFGGNPYIAQDMVLCGDMNDDPDTDTMAALKGDGATRLIDVLESSGPSFPTHTKYKKTRLDYILASPTLDISEPKIHTEEEAVAEASDHYPVSAKIRVKS